MKLAAIITENRFDVSDIIADHKQLLPVDTTIIHNNDKSIQTERDYNELMTSKSFWKDLEHFDRVLIFQHDSRILRPGIEEFYEWDYIGAPWNWQLWGCNGGLSLRNPKRMLEVIEMVTYTPQHQNEDVYFSNIMKQNPRHFNLAPREVCKKFSCEAIFELGTWGTHAIERYLTPEQCNSIYNQYAGV